jgi:hypothetical protein
MLIAEGSDWFWWYGDDHSSDHDREFDELFRRHVQNVYRALELPIPDELLVSNITTQPSEVRIDPPTGFVHPVIDGETTSYFEWLGAGSVNLETAAGAMHQVSDASSGIQSIDFGFDLHNLYLRVSGSRSMEALLNGGLSLSVNFLAPAGVRMLVRSSGSGGYDLGIVVRAGAVAEVRGCPESEVAVGRVAELKLPFTCLGLEPGASVAFLVAVNRGGTELEHHPQDRPVELTVPDRQFAATHWTA